MYNGAMDEMMITITLAHQHVFAFMQQKVKEERDAKRATMDGRHDYILSTVAERLGMKQDDVEEFMLDDDQVKGKNPSCMLGRLRDHPPNHA